LRRSALATRSVERSAHNGCPCDVHLIAGLRRQTLDQSSFFPIGTSGVGKRSCTTESISSSLGTGPENVILQPRTATLLFPKLYSLSFGIIPVLCVCASANTVYELRHCTATVLLHMSQTSPCQFIGFQAPGHLRPNLRWRPPTRRYLSVSITSSITASMTRSHQTPFRGSVALFDLESSG
jgi:hypothetical protein